MRPDGLTFAAEIRLESRDYGNNSTEVGPKVVIGRNSNATNQWPGILTLTRADNGAEVDLWVDSSGDLRIGTLSTNPDSDGVVVGTQS